VSRRHAAIRAENGGWTIVETNAGTNGTFLNGAKLDAFKAYPVEDGDLVQLALVPLRMRVLADGG
jgi:pSer/pThr/pTyr-binding forkhead associated (FHA) protein